jgi:hypothetical protein
MAETVAVVSVLAVTDKITISEAKAFVLKVSAKTAKMAKIEYEIVFKIVVFIYFFIFINAFIIANTNHFVKHTTYYKPRLDLDFYTLTCYNIARN